MLLKKLNMTVRAWSTSVMVCTLLLLYHIPRSILLDHKHSRCIVHQLFGIDCPGCGVTRALYFFLHGDIIAAIELNVGILLIIPICATEILSTLIRPSKTISTVRSLQFKMLPFLLLANYIFKHH